MFIVVLGFIGAQAAQAHSSRKRGIYKLFMVHCYFLHLMKVVTVVTKKAQNDEISPKNTQRRKR